MTENIKFIDLFYANRKFPWKQLGNTIPTIFTEMIGLNLKKYLMMCAGS